MSISQAIRSFWYDIQLERDRKRDVARYYNYGRSHAPQLRTPCHIDHIIYRFDLCSSDIQILLKIIDPRCPPSLTEKEEAARLRLLHHFQDRVAAQRSIAKANGCSTENEERRP